jgi:hypothetical protein
LDQEAFEGVNDQHDGADGDADGFDEYAEQRPEGGGDFEGFFGFFVRFRFGLGAAAEGAGGGWPGGRSVVGDGQTLLVFEEFTAEAAFERFGVDLLAAKGAFFCRILGHRAVQISVNRRFWQENKHFHGKRNHRFLDAAEPQPKF